MSAPEPSRLAGFRGELIGQFRRPHGLLGKLAGFILAHRGSNLERNAWTVDLLGIQPTDHVLELGFGPGVSISSASRLAHLGTVTGIDHSATMVQMASRRNAIAIRDGRVNLIEAPLEPLPIFKRDFDKIFAVNALQFANEPAALLHALRKRMRTGGLIAVTQQSRKPGATDQDSILAATRMGELLERSGFRRARVETLALKPVCAACALAEAS